MIVAAWNRRPCDEIDPALAEACKPKMYFFKSQEEAKAYFESRGEPWDESVLYMSVLR